MKLIPEMFLSYDVAVIQWITSCYKNHMTARVITLGRVHVTSLTKSVSTVRFLIEIMSILKGHMIKKSLTRVVISYENI